MGRLEARGTRLLLRWATMMCLATTAKLGKAQVSTPSRELRAETSRRAVRGDAATMGKVAVTSAPNAVPKRPSAFHDNPARPCVWRHHQTTMTFKIKAADLKRMEEGLDILSAERVRIRPPSIRTGSHTLIKRGLQIETSLPSCPASSIWRTAVIALRWTRRAYGIIPSAEGSVGRESHHRLGTLI